MVASEVFVNLIVEWQANQQYSFINFFKLSKATQVWKKRNEKELLKNITLVGRQKYELKSQLKFIEQKR